MITTLGTIIAPYASPINLHFYALLALAVLGVTLAFLLYTKRILLQNRLRGLLGMLAGFIGLVSFSAVIFTWVHAGSIQPIVFEEDVVSVGGQLLEYKKIEKSYIKPLLQKSRYTAEINTDTALIFVIEMRDGRSHLLSNDNYDLRAVATAMDKYKK